MDLKLNFSSPANEPALNEQQRAGTFVATALAARNEVTSKALVGRACAQAYARGTGRGQGRSRHHGDEQSSDYRFTHLASAPDCADHAGQAA